MVKEKTLVRLRERFEKKFGPLGGRRQLAVTSPGRIEIAGNHTDHQGGNVIAGAVNSYVQGLFVPSGTDVLCVSSAGFGTTKVKLSSLEVRDDEYNTTASLVRGMAAQFQARGIEPQGFDAAIVTGVAGGSGLSSSAAFELELAQAMNVLWAAGKLPAADLALMAQRAEREWFGKPCGLMDQASVALGGIQAMCFKDPTRLEAHKLDFDFGEVGYKVCIVSVGADHKANTHDYASVPAEMVDVAESLGARVLSDLDEADVIGALPRLRTKLGDRAVLRAIHYFREMRLVEARVKALEEHDIETFLTLTRESGKSSGMYLQNVSIGNTEDQPSMVAIALAEELLEGAGAVRVHGGGFGGTIQAFVPTERAEAFAHGMDAVFGHGASGIYEIDQKGSRARWAG